MTGGGLRFPRESRYARVADVGRRSFLRTALAAAAGAVIAACSRNDADVFGVSGQSVAAD